MATRKETLRDIRAMGLVVVDDRDWGEIIITLPLDEVMRLNPRITTKAGAIRKAEALSHHVDRHDLEEALAAGAVLRGWADFRARKMGLAH